WAAGRGLAAVSRPASPRTTRGMSNPREGRGRRSDGAVAEVVFRGRTPCNPNPPVGVVRDRGQAAGGWRGETKTVAEGLTRRRNCQAGESFCDSDLQFFFGFQPFNS